ncbi:hypothetical protein QOT17_000362 [Balamuthia mandrillaris]
MSGWWASEQQKDEVLQSFDRLQQKFDELVGTCDKQLVRLDQCNNQRSPSGGGGPQRFSLVMRDGRPTFTEAATTKEEEEARRSQCEKEREEVVACMQAMGQRFKLVREKCPRFKEEYATCMTEQGGKALQRCVPKLEELYACATRVLPPVSSSSSPRHNNSS